MRITLPRIPSIKYFEVVREIIEENIGILAQQKGISRDEAYAEVLAHLQANSSQWNSNNPPLIPYNDPMCRIAYLYGIVPVNANLIEYVFEMDSEIEDFLDLVQDARHEVNVCAFGGGPGTELLGLCKRIERRRLGNQITVNFSLIDRVNEWADSWFALQRQINERFRHKFGNNRNDWPLTVSGNFLGLDMSDVSNLYNWGSIFGQDIYIMSYLIFSVNSKDCVHSLLRWSNMRLKALSFYL